MFHRFTPVFFVLCVFALAACATKGQNVYDSKEVGKEQYVMFGEVVDIQDAKIIGDKSGAGAAAGGVVGAAAGAQVGKGSGQWAGGLLGGILGAVTGTAAEEAVRTKTAANYTIVTEVGTTVSIVQELKSDDPEIRVGDRVMIQGTGENQRVIPANRVTDELNRPRGIIIKEN